jgi:hypothetical protein
MKPSVFEEVSEICFKFGLLNPEILRSERDKPILIAVDRPAHGQPYNVETCEDHLASFYGRPVSVIFRGDDAGSI